MNINIRRGEREVLTLPEVRPARLRESRPSEADKRAGGDHVDGGHGQVLAVPDGALVRGSGLGPWLRSPGTSTSAKRTAATPPTITGSARWRSPAKATNMTTVATTTPIHTDRSRVSNVPMAHRAATPPAATLAVPRHFVTATHDAQRAGVEREAVGYRVGERSAATAAVDAVVEVIDVFGPNERVRSRHLE